MVKKAMLSIALAWAFVFGVSYVHAEDVTLSEIVELFISLGIIPSDKAEAARDAVEGMGAGQVVTGASPEHMCVDPGITRTLGPGSTDATTGGEVTKLQEFLAANPTWYPEGLVTGYYGELTTKAVQRFQAEKGVVSSGDPDSTGYGLVGPRTRAALAECNDMAGAPGMPPAPGIPFVPGAGDDMGSTMPANADEYVPGDPNYPASEAEPNEAGEAVDVEDEDVMLPPPPPPPTL